MYWQNPTYLWAEILPGLLLLGWIISEVVHLRRLKIFGDPLVLGVSVPWVPRIAALFMLLLGIACAAAVIPLPAMHEATSAADVPIIQVLVDVHSLESAEDQTWEAFDAALQALVEQVPGTRFSAIALGSPAEVLVYPTVDMQGLQIILARLRFASPPGNKLDLAQALLNYAASQRGQSRTARSIVVTALPADEVERVSASVNGSDFDFLFANISSDSPPIQYGHRNAAGDLVWTARAADLQQPLKADQTRFGRRAYLNPTQWFALMAVIFLCVEYICSLSARSRTGRMQVA
jgi:hypothetical protein